MSSSSSSSSKHLSLLIPSIWSQQQQQASSNRPASIQSTSSSNTPSWSSLSFDQLSFYTRRASNSSLSILASNHSDQQQDNKKKKRQKERMQHVVHDLTQVFLLSLNDCSLGFFRISDHIHRKVPRIVENKHKLKQTRLKVDVAISDIEDVRKSVCEIERIESFYNMSKMIERSMEILKSKNKQLLLL